MVTANIRALLANCAYVAIGVARINGNNPDDREKVVETVKRFLGIDNSPWHRRRVRPLEKTHDGIAKRLSRRQYKE